MKKQSRKYLVTIICCLVFIVSIAYVGLTSPKRTYSAGSCPSSKKLVGNQYCCDKTEESGSIQWSNWNIYYGAYGNTSVNSYSTFKSLVDTACSQNYDGYRRSSNSYYFGCTPIGEETWENNDGDGAIGTYKYYTHCVSSDSYVNCIAGEYLENGKTSCTQCPRNYYCPGGVYQINSGEFGKIQCSPDSYASPGASVCTCQESTKRWNKSKNDSNSDAAACEGGSGGSQTSNCQSTITQSVYNNSKKDLSSLSFTPIDPAVTCTGDSWDSVYSAACSSGKLSCVSCANTHEVVNEKCTLKTTNTQEPDPEEPGSGDQTPSCSSTITQSVYNNSKKDLSSLRFTPLDPAVTCTGDSWDSTYSAVCSGGKLSCVSCANTHEVVNEKCTLKSSIDPSKILKLNCTDKNLIYNGILQSPGCKCPDHSTLIAGNLSAIDAGEYTFKCEPDSPDYTFGSNPNEFKWSIAQKSIEVKWEPTSTVIVYDGKEHEIKISADTGVLGETMKLKFSLGNAYTKIKDIRDLGYSFVATCDSVTGGQKSCINYNLTKTNKTYHIVKNSSNLGSGTAKFYNGASLIKTLTCQMEVDEFGVSSCEVEYPDYTCPNNQTFRGWVTTQENCGGNSVVGQQRGAILDIPNDGEVVERYACCYKENSSYSITYKDCGNKEYSGSSVSPTTYTNGKSVDLATPSKTCYRFDGWYKQSTCDANKISRIDSSEYGNKVFYAKWTYTCGGGTNNPGGNGNYTPPSDNGNNGGNNNNNNNTNTNPKTGSELIYVVWTIGLLMIGYAAWYFKNGVKE